MGRARRPSPDGGWLLDAEPPLEHAPEGVDLGDVHQRDAPDVEGPDGSGPHRGDGPLEVDGSVAGRTGAVDIRHVAFPFRMVAYQPFCHYYRPSPPKVN